jgi:hypothetical protein
MLQQVRLPIHCHPKIAFSLFAALVFVTSIGVAELPPDVYKQWQQHAPEALLIKVLSVELITRSRDEEKTIVFVTIQAQVQSVWRSDSGLSPGTEHKSQYVGPSQVPILVARLSYPAYLKEGGEMGASYSPAAGGYSFKTVE